MPAGVARARLVAKKGVKKDLPVRDYTLSPRFGDLTFLRTATSAALEAIGLSAFARQVRQSGLDHFGLDGMLARENRTALAQACFEFLPSRARLDLQGWENEDIFAHS